MTPFSSFGFLSLLSDDTAVGRWACHIPTVAVKASELAFCVQKRSRGLLTLAFTPGPPRPDWSHSLAKLTSSWPLSSVAEVT